MHLRKLATSRSGFAKAVWTTINDQHECRFGALDAFLVVLLASGALALMRFLLAN